ncbi:MAG: GGDEF domain-containing protein, partial [Treponema sp.]|nr:GGDEF domain-containing protein [Treponema sp.]
LNLSGKYRETDLLNCEINAIADIYEAVARINLASGDIEPIRTCPQFEALLEGDYSRYSERVPSLAEKIAAPNALILVRDFLETSTLQERMNGVSSISIECLDTKERWIRLRYILIHRDEQGNLATVMLAFESIDEDRRRQENLKKLSESDMMTGVQNRGSGEMKVRSALADGKTGMFCLMDVDNFKSINDNYGHQTGDDVIKAIAECLKKTFRDSDIVFRLGGDEFAVFSEGVTDRNLGKRIIDRFFANVEAISLPALKNRPVCVSVGAAFYPGNSSDTFEDLYAQADSGTYKSKREPGNLLTFIN